MVMRIFFLILCFLSWVVAYAEPSAEVSPEELVEFSYEKPTDVTTLTKDIGRILGKTILIGKGPSAKISIITQGKVSKELAYELYLAALRQVGYSLAETSFVSKIFPIKKSFFHSPIIEGPMDLLYSEEAVIQVLRLKNASAKNILRFLSSSLGPGNAIQFRENLLLLSGSYSHLKGVLSTIELLDQEVSSDRALRVLPIRNTKSKEIYSKLKELGFFGKKSFFQSGLVVEEPRSNSLFVLGPEEYQKKIKETVRKLDSKNADHVGKEFFIRALDFAEAKQVASTLSALKSSDSSNKKKKKKKKSKNQKDSFVPNDYDVIADEANNSLIIYSTAKQYEGLLGLLEKLDRKRAQIFFEIDILEISDGFDFKFTPSSLMPLDIVPGKATLIQGWKSEKVMPILEPGDGENGEATPTQLSSKMGSVSEDLILGVLTKGKFEMNGLSGISPGALIQIMKTDKASRVISSPFIMSLDGESASFVASDTKTFLVSETSQGPKSGSKEAGAIKRNKIEKESSEILLDLTAFLDSDTDLTLDLDLKVNSIIGINKDGLPDTSKKRVKQKVNLESGQTVFVSGFKVTEELTTLSKIPLLGDIPILGWLFRYNDDLQKDSRILIFITPHITWGDKDLKSLYKKKFEERLSDIEIFKKKNLL